MKKKVKNKFKEIRELNNLTQTEEAKLLGVSVHHISEFENTDLTDLKEGNKSMAISLSLILRISTLYKIPIDYFFSDKSRKFKLQCLYSFIWLSDLNTQLEKIKIHNQFYYGTDRNIGEKAVLPENKSIPQIINYKENSFFCNNLKFYRIKRNMSQVELSIKLSEIMSKKSHNPEETHANTRANLSGISWENVKRIENSNRNMTIHHAKAASELFDIPLFFLVQTDKEIDTDHYLKFRDALPNWSEAQLDRQIRDYLKPNYDLTIPDEEESK